MTTRTTFKILTRKKNGQSHRETEVTIDWKNVSVDDLKILAKNAIVQDLQARIQRGDFDSFPVKVEILAKDIIHRESAALWEYQPNAVRPPKPPVLPRELEQLLKTLSPDELKTLLA